MSQLTLLTHEPEPEESADERLAGILYNALFCFEWQLKRVQSGTWDDYSERLLTAGLKTARRVLAEGRTFGRYGRKEIEALVRQARAYESEAA